MREYETMRGHRSQTVFFWPYCPAYVFKRFGELLEDAGLPNTRRNKLHKIRRTAASNFEAAGGNATDLLDHDSRKTTKKSYLDPKVIKSIQPADIMPGIGEKPESTKPDGPDLTQLLDKLRDILINSVPIPFVSLKTIQRLFMFNRRNVLCSALALVAAPMALVKASTRCDPRKLPYQSLPRSR